jgi:hypothetical protein
MDYSAPSGLCQRLDEPPTARRYRQCQSSKGRQGPRGLEAPAGKLLLHICEDVGQGEERVQPDYHQCREDSAYKHAQHLLDLAFSLYYYETGWISKAIFSVSVDKMFMIQPLGRYKLIVLTLCTFRTTNK